MIEAKVTINQAENLPRIANDFLRRSYTVEHGPTVITLSGGIKTDVTTPLDTIEFLYLKVETDDAEVNVYRNLSPEYWTVTDTFMAMEIQNCTRLALKSDVDATVTLFLAGE